MIDLESKVKGKEIRIVFTEGKDLRMMKAAVLLQQKGLLIPILYGDRKELLDLADRHGLDLSDIPLLDVKEFQDKEAMLHRMLELRKGKADRDMVEAWYQKDSYFCTMYVEMGFADGLLGGSTNSTADTLRPIMQLIKTSPGNSIVSSCFLMCKEQEHYIFADCSLNRNPNVDQLVEIALQSANSAKSLGITPCVALLSYSTYGSGSGEDVDLVKEAATRLQRLPLDYLVDGELQVDCALNPEVAKLKAPQSKVGGQANVLVFPDLNAANIGYKLVANLGGYQAYGPILQGVRLPMNDLSRSANVEEIYTMALITASQKLNMKPTCTSSQP
ncbi:phosphate acetyltransferase [[Eubacterium] hominis]|uniref:phosphate acetyltransferase n=1 Tax=[Eubacterium] hominis TaxID=2764325 RepID=UPI003A4D75C4